MSWTEKNKYKIAILDLNDGHENQGMRCLRDITRQWGEENEYDLTVQEFDVRVKDELPGTEFDIYISSGGPGSPLDSEDSKWEKHYFNWLHKIEKWNNDESNFTKKHVFFICHSFQLACRHYNIAKVSRRKSTSFGVFPIHLMHDGSEEIVFEGLKDPFYAVDSRDYQVTSPNHNKIHEMGGRILALEKERPYVPYERAVMAIRFNEYFIGTQFHPEADPFGMTMHLQKDDKKKIVIENHGEEKWKSMIDQLNDPDKILYTYSHVFPNFLNHAVTNLAEA